MWAPICFAHSRTRRPAASSHLGALYTAIFSDTPAASIEEADGHVGELRGQGCVDRSVPSDQPVPHGSEDHVDDHLDRAAAGDLASLLAPPEDLGEHVLALPEPGADAG